MTPAKRRPTRRTRAATKDSTQEGLEAEPEPTEPEETGVLGPDGRPLTRPAPETEGPTEEELAANEEVLSGVRMEVQGDRLHVAGSDLELTIEAAPTGDAGGDSAPTTETGQVEPEDRATTQSPGRSRAHPERVWPD